MKDENGNGIPDKIDRIVAGLLMLALAVFQAIQAAAGDAYEWAAWVPWVQAVIPIAAGWFAVQGRPGGGAVASVLVLLLAGGLIAGAGCNKYEAAYKTTYVVAKARNSTDVAIGKAFLARVNKCEKSHKAHTPEFKACVEKTTEYKAILHWRDHARPAVTAAIRATVAALELAEKLKQDPGNWLAVLKPAACVLVKMMDDFGSILPADVKVVLSEVRGVCK